MTANQYDYVAPIKLSSSRITVEYVTYFALMPPKPKLCFPAIYIIECDLVTIYIGCLEILGIWTTRMHGTVWTV